MPLSINVGLSKKASRDYQSTGVSINVTAELDQSLLAKPDELQKQIGDLYSQAEGAMNRQAALLAESNPSQRNGRDDARSNRGNGHNGGNGNGGRRSSNGNGGGHMTESQRRAVNSIADRLNIDAVLESRDIIGAEFDELSVRQASELIDHLKSMQPAGNGSRR